MTNSFSLHLGDCLETLRGMPDNSVHAICTDPPYGLSQHKPDEVVECLRAWLAGEVYAPKGKGFMGKAWDAWVPGPEVWRECLRVLKPGGHVLAFAGTRSMDLMSMAIRLAGFELRDAVGYAHDGGGAPLLAYCYGSGFPKSHDVSKAIDREAGAVREVLSERVNRSSFDPDAEGGGGFQRGTIQTTTPATEAARQWQGWGSALKPAWEPIILARKPLVGTLASNVLEWGTGALNIDGCRVVTDDKLGGGATSGAVAAHDGYRRPWMDNPEQLKAHSERCADNVARAEALGRWPANLIHDGSPEVVAGFPVTGPSKQGVRDPNGSMGYHGGAVGLPGVLGGHSDNGGSAARFFYCAKASKADRDAGLNAFAEQQAGVKNSSGRGFSEGDPYAKVMRKNVHPTVKPTDLMAYLVRLVTPPGGVVLDPFMGSGSTGKAAMREGMRFIGCELSEEYMAIARARIEHELALVTAANAPKPQADLFV